MKHPYFTVLISYIVILAGCSSGLEKKAEKTSSTFVDYEVRYLEQEKELRALATFRQGDSLETAVNKQFSNVSFQGSDMELQHLGERGFRYILNRKGPFSNNLQFRFKNEQGNDIVYDLSMAPIGSFSIKEGKVQKSKGITITWDGPPLEASQSMVFMFTDKSHKASSTFAKGPTKGSKVFIPSKDLSALSLGEWQFYIVKKQVLELREESQSVQSIVEFYTKAIAIEVID